MVDFLVNLSFNLLKLNVGTSSPVISLDAPMGTSKLRSYAQDISLGIFLIAANLFAAPSSAADRQNLRVALDNNYPPYSFLNLDGQLHGYLIDIWKLWESKTGVHVELIAHDWNDALEAMKSGQADVIDTIFKTPARQLTFDFTAPYADLPVSIFAHSDIGGLVTTTGLRGFLIGVKAGDACIDYLRARSITTIEVFSSYELIVDAAKIGKIKVFCLDDPPANFLLYRSGIHQNFRIAFPLYSGQFHRAVHKGDVQTLALVERGFSAISKSENQVLLDNWFGTPLGASERYAVFFKYGLVVTIVLAIFITLWVWFLRREVNRRTFELAAERNRLDILAHHDSLTNLPNRAQLLDKLRHSLIVAQENKSHVAVLFIDLDGFKHVNESLGHPFGDQLLREASIRMQTNLKTTSTIARLGGDEFVALLETSDVNEPPALSAAINVLFSEPLLVDGRTIYITASVGIALYPDDSDDADTLLKFADLAMYRAKEQGRNTFSFYQAAMGEQARRRLHISDALRSSLHNSELFLVYQPQIQISDRMLVGAEALLRWRNPDFGFIPPDEFIPIAEENGTILEIGAWVIYEACRQLAEWRRAGFIVPRMAINLSVQQIEHGGLINLIQSALSQFNLMPSDLELEITESMAMADSPWVSGTIEHLMRSKLLLSIDDFGTGHSSLARLKMLPVHRLKIDKSFVQDIGMDKNNEAIIRAIIKLSHSLGLDVVAEGVERVEQADFLMSQNCEIAQGYLFSKPVSPSELMFKWRGQENTYPENVITYHI